MSKLDSLREVLYLRLSDLQNEIDSLKAENEKLANAGHALYHALGYFTSDFAFMEEYNFSEEKKSSK